MEEYKAIIVSAIKSGDKKDVRFLIEMSNEEFDKLMFKDKIVLKF